MKSSRFLSFLVLYIVFMDVQRPGRSEWLFPRRCPRFKEQCEYKERDLCTKDRQCDDNERCCIFNCGKKCLNVKEDICAMPRVNGLCLAYFHRWWYNKKNNTCSHFIYGGCKGNNNNFQTKDMCLNACYKAPSSS
nr:eppin-like [Microcebus murinus]